MTEHQLSRLVKTHLMDMTKTGIFPIGIIFDVTQPITEVTPAIPVMPNLGYQSEAELERLLNFMGTMLMKGMQDNPSLKQVVARAMTQLYEKEMRDKDEIDPQELLEFIKKHTQ